ncbi:L-threonylcarbamoyladenylate synthase [Prosthecomicrobium pneumaticum]|uniref:Threonylcarbamoyl-AMP synthase n=1 Tax=Prosthecomicrobium pneumaticum TaxID=81895 RepID=A0A7W9CUY7_9HYPH|nr:L-threonylcarbamoyladenylate synthase [Prosthecomicrobium pneumaticum]MBB5752071.1 L-threonylcarbamoyladenylate synthase [Prosthecomicrobium pneumaticum]
MSERPLLLSAADPRSIERAIAALAAGDLVALPTETVYGLAADATNGAAVAGIYAAKGRPRFNPLIAHVADRAAADRLVVLDADLARLAAAFWPGPLTLVASRRAEAGVADLVTAGLDTLAVRVPAHPVARAVLAAFDRPVAAPSANRSGHVSATEAAHVAADLGAAVAVILDAGPAPMGLESTIVGAGPNGPVLLRPGAIARGALEAVLGRPLAKAPASAAHAPAAPGMLASHYAPAAAVRLRATAVRPGEALLAFGPDLPEGWREAAAVVQLSERGDLVEASARLFAALRTLDGKAAVIAVAPIPQEGLGEAINDRLARAAAPRPAADPV